MKKILKFVLLTLVVVLGCSSLPSCNRESVPLPRSVVDLQNISYDVAKDVYKDMVNPTFVSVDEVSSWQDLMIRSVEEDSVFLTMSSKALFDVSAVCIKRDGSATKRSIVREYLNNRAVYDNLPKTDPIPTAVTNTEPPQRPEDSAVRKDKSVEVSYSTKDTTINGKRTTIETKTSTYNE